MTVKHSALALVFLAAVAGTAQAHEPPVTIRDVQVGFPSSSGHLSRMGAWAPVMVRVRGDDRNASVNVVVESQDSDDVQYQYYSGVPELTGRDKTVISSYVRPGNRSGKLTVRLVWTSDTLESVVNVGQSARMPQYDVINSVDTAPDYGNLLRPDDVLYLVLGSRLPGLETAIETRKSTETEATEGPRTTRRVAAITSADELPLEWFGYSAVDVVLLPTANREFLSTMLKQRTDGRDPAAALGEWVHCGGRLVIGVGANRDLVDQVLYRMHVTDFELLDSRSVERVAGVEQWARAEKTRFPERGKVDLTRFRLKQAAASLVGDGGEPVIAIAPCGVGRVLLVGFDFESPALTEWKGQPKLWEKIHAEVGPRMPTRKAGQDSGRADEIATELQRGLESFDGIAVISFGWVAFFILLYILVVSPLDYYLLHKVFKKPELTWFTFPAEVLLIGVAVYFSAYGVKGKELRFTKIDVVDIDLHHRQIIGTSLFSVFSPSVESYTIGLEPAPDWMGSTRLRPSPVVTPLSPPDNSSGGVDRPGSQSLYRRPYVYAPEACGIREIPIPFGAARSFSASWNVRFLREGELVTADDFMVARDGVRLIGRIRNHLPVELSDVSLCYNGVWHQLDNIPAHGSYRIDARDIQRIASSNVGQWLSESFGREGASEKDSARSVARKAEVLTPETLMKSILFYGHEGNPNGALAASGLRNLDQGWRLRPLPVASAGAEKPYLAEALVVARAVVPQGPAEEVTQSGASPTRLWLGRLPDGGKRPPVPGLMRQETYIRIWIPVLRE